jgi:hypothetical protein
VSDTTTVRPAEPDDDQPVTKGDVRDLQALVGHLADTNTWRRIGKWALWILGIIAFVALMLGSVALIQTRAQVQKIAQQQTDIARLNACLAVFAAATADRTGTLAPLSADRQRAQDARSDAEVNLILSTLVPTDGSSKAERLRVYRTALGQLQTAQAIYRDANQAYQAASAAHPPLAPPSEGCATDAVHTG